MTPATIIQEAKSEGVKITLSASGSIKAIGDQSAVSRWLPIIKESKPAIIAMLSDAANDSPSWGWRVRYSDTELLEIYTTPTATHSEVLRDFPGALSAEPFTRSLKQPSGPISAEQEATIRAWLARIKEADPYIIADVLERCRNDADARDYFIVRAGE